jgi:acetyl-CoA synthetase
MGYYKDPKATEEARKFGWHHTGDLALIDENGEVLFLDRKKDMIKSGGENVASVKIEEALLAHPAVRECAVFAAELPDRRMTLKAVVVMNERTFDADATTKLLQDFVKARLLPYKYPREITFIDELPKTGTGKIDRQALLKL